MEFDAGISLPSSRSVALAMTEAPVSSVLASPIDEESLWQMSLRMGENINFGSYPERPGEPDCAYYLRTGLCRFGSTCRFNHPPNRKLAAARMKDGYPERVGQPECQYYLKTGTCKFGPTCKFNHPKEKSGITGRAQMNILGYPLRPNEKECAYYLRTGQCKFGNTCKFHHPQPSLRGSSFYPSVHSPMNSSQQPTNWSLSKASFVGPRWQGGPSSFTQLILPQGLVQVPNWSSFPTQFGSASSLESQQPNPVNSQLLGSSHQRETSADSSASFLSFRFGPIPVGQGAIHKDSAFPERFGEPECQYYMKTGDCKFGAVCRFHHPRERLIPAPNCVLSPLGLPLRSGEPLCMFYSRYGVCKFGPNCKFDHPVTAPMGIFAYSLAATPSSDIPIVRRLMGSSSGPPALAFSSDGSPETGPGKSRRLSSSDSQQMDSGDDNIESE